MKYKAVVDEQFVFPELSAGELDLIPDGNEAFHLLVNGKSYHAALDHADWEKRTIRLYINGRKYTVRLKDEYDQLIDQLGLQAANHHLVKDIKAPMPGLVLKVEVKPGQAVAAGDPLIVLEAMKMENIIKARADSRIKTLHTQEGNAVEKGQLLIEME